MKKKNITDKSKINIIIYFLLRTLVIISLVIQGIHGNWNNTFLCIFTLILFTVPDLVSKKLNLKLPNTLEVIVYIFIFSSSILGEIQNFYDVFPHWDTMLHTLNGFLCAAVGFSLVDILNNNIDAIDMTPAFVSLVAFCFSMTIGIFWEFIEFSIDKYLNKDMQKDLIVTKINSIKINDERSNEAVNINDINRTIICTDKSSIIIEGGYLDIGLFDTIKDLYVNFIGAIIFCLIGYVYIKNRHEKSFANMFIPKVNRTINIENYSKIYYD